MSRGVKGLLESFGDVTLCSFYKQVYKSTACGPTIGFLIDSSWIYNGDLPSLTLKEMREAGHEVDGVSVSSIVEGSDVEIPAVRFYGAFDPDEFWKAVEEVNEKADAEWDLANSEYFSIILPDGQKVFGQWKPCEDDPEIDLTFVDPGPHPLRDLPVEILREALDMASVVVGSKPVEVESIDGHSTVYMRYEASTIVKVNGYVIEAEEGPQFYE